MGAVNYIFEYLLCLSEVVVFYLLISYLADSKPKYSKAFIGFSILITAFIIFVITSFQFPIYIKGPLGILIHLIFSSIYHFSSSHKLFIILLFNLITVLVEVLFISFVSAITDIHSTEIIGLHSSLRYSIALISKLGIFLSVYAVAKAIKPNKIFLPRKYSLLILGIFILTISIMVFLFQKSLILSVDTEISHILFVTSLAFIIINIAVFYYYIRSNQFYLDKQKNETEKLYQKANEQYINESERQSEYLHKIWHDINNHIKNLELLIASSEHKESLQYIKSLKQSADKIQDNILTGNKIADVIINRKSNDAKLNNIDFKVKASIPSTLPIKDADFSSILFNTIDNAIEASLNIQNKENRLIDIKIYPKKQYLCYEIINNINPSQLPQSKKHFNKKEYIPPGYGLMILQDIADRYDGYLDYGVKGRQFILGMYLLLL